MRAMFAFTKKEVCEQVRSYKLFLMLIIFFAFGVMSPLAAKYMPDIIAKFMPAGMDIKIADPTALDSWQQFFKNVSQMGLIVMVIIFSSAIASELSKGTLIPMLTKGLPRRAVIIAKFFSTGLLWTVSYWFCFLLSFAYTSYFWESKTEHLILAIVSLWVFGLMLLAVELLGGVLTKSNYGAMLFTGAVVVVLTILNMLPKLQKYNPIRLSSGNMGLLQGTIKPDGFVIPMILSLVILVLSLAFSILLFNRKQI